MLSQQLPNQAVQPIGKPKADNPSFPSGGYLPKGASQTAAPYGLTQLDRYDSSPLQYSRSLEDLDYGPSPQQAMKQRIYFVSRIPRLWSTMLNAMAGPRQFGHQQADYGKYFPAVVPTTPGRTSSASVALSAGGAADRYSVPPTYVPVTGSK